MKPRYLVCIVNHNKKVFVQYTVSILMFTDKQSLLRFPFAYGVFPTEKVTMEMMLKITKSSYIQPFIKIVMNVMRRLLKTIIIIMS